MNRDANRLTSCAHRHTHIICQTRVHNCTTNLNSEKQINSKQHLKSSLSKKGHLLWSSPLKYYKMLVPNLLLTVQTRPTPIKQVQQNNNNKGTHVKYHCVFTSGKRNVSPVSSLWGQCCHYETHLRVSHANRAMKSNIDGDGRFSITPRGSVADQIYFAVAIGRVVLQNFELRWRQRVR